MFSSLTSTQVLSILALIIIAFFDLVVIAILIIKRKKLNHGWRNTLTILAFFLSLTLVGLLGLIYAAGSNQPAVPPQPYPLPVKQFIHQ